MRPRFTGVAAPRTSLRATLRSWTIAAAAVVIGAVTLGAQAPVTEEDIPLATGAQRQPDLERQAGGAGDARSIRVYQWTAPTEILLKFYIRKLGGIREGVLDTASLASFQPGEATPISYHLTFFAFDDECYDSETGAATAGADPATCKSRRRGKDKRRALGGHVALDPDLWIDRATFRWFSRSPEGDLDRWQVELRDIGLSKNWQHWRPLTQLTIEKVQLKGSAP